MAHIERLVQGEARAITRREVIGKAIVGQLSWVQAVEVLAIKPAAAHPASNRVARDGRRGWSSAAPRRKRIKLGTNRVVVPAQARALSGLFGAALS